VTARPGASPSFRHGRLHLADGDQCDTYRDGQLRAVSLSGQVTVTFTVRSVETTDLTVKAFMEQKGTGSRWNLVGSVHQLSVPSQLQPGQTGNH